MVAGRLGFQQFAGGMSPLVLGDEACVSFCLPVSRLFGLLGAVAIGGVNAFIDELRVGSTSPAAAFEKAHQVGCLVSVRRTIGRDTWEPIAIRLTQPRGIPSRRWVFDAGILRIHITATLFILVLLWLRIGQELKLLRVFGAPLGANFGLMGEQKTAGRPRTLCGRRGAVTIASAQLVIEGRQHLRATAKTASADGRWRGGTEWRGRLARLYRLVGGYGFDGLGQDLRVEGDIASRSRRPAGLGGGRGGHGCREQRRALLGSGAAARHGSGRLAASIVSVWAVKTRWEQRLQTCLGSRSTNSDAMEMAVIVLPCGDGVPNDANRVDLPGNIEVAREQRIEISVGTAMRVVWKVSLLPFLS